mmetsp:Transcript_9085/g.21533  ORF Transcript_9085/g.21533 Transcript_9085/m.21533 type:complete len:83 (+) Transcript_9085:77-325(+)
MPRLTGTPWQCKAEFRYYLKPPSGSQILVAAGRSSDDRTYVDSGCAISIFKTREMMVNLQSPTMESPGRSSSTECSSIQNHR